MIHTCRFDPTCGTFSGPRSLTDHYRKAHADEFVEVVHPTRQCRHCGQALKPSTISGHMRKIHHVEPPFPIHLLKPGETFATAATTQLDERDECPHCDAVLLVENLPRHIARKHPHATTATSTTALDVAVPEMPVIDPQRLNNEHGIDAELIVANAFELLAAPTGLIPAHAIMPMLVWHTATQQMLRDVLAASREQ